MSNTAIFFSGVENLSFYEAVVNAGIRKCLISYFYILHRGRDVVKRYKDICPDMEILVDSGAHTFQQQLASFSKEQYDIYCQEYARWLNDNREYICGCVELDAEEVVGLDRVYMWQEKYFMPLEKSGFPVIYVWHPVRDFREFVEMCKRHKFVGVAQDLYKSKQASLVNVQIAARKTLTAIHGFGITRVSWLSKNMFASCDSTTWKAGEIYGVAYVFDNGHLKPLVYSQTDEKALWRNYYVEAGCDPDKIMAGNGKELTKLNLYSWSRYVQYLEDTFSKKICSWDLRPPVSKLISEFSDDMVREWAWRLRFAQDRAQIEAEPDVDSMRNFVMLMAMLINREEDLIRKNADLISTWIRPLLEVLEPMSEDATVSLIDTYSKAACNYVLLRASSVINIEPRTAEEYEPVVSILPREPVNEDDLFLEETYEVDFD